MSKAVAPINHRVHSAAKVDQLNSRTIIAEVRFTRFHLIVCYDHADDLFKFSTFEHNREVDEQISRSDEKPLLEKMATSMEQIGRDHLHQRRFCKTRGVNIKHLPRGGVEGIRTYHPSRVPQRSIFDRYKPFDPRVPDK